MSHCYLDFLTLCPYKTTSSLQIPKINLALLDIFSLSRDFSIFSFFTYLYFVKFILCPTYSSKSKSRHYVIETSRSSAIIYMTVTHKSPDKRTVDDTILIFGIAF